MMTDKNRLREALRNFAESRTPRNIEAVADVVGRAQNGPPDGEADGTLTEEAWYAARDWVDAARVFYRASQRLKETLNG